MKWYSQICGRDAYGLQESGKLSHGLYQWENGSAWAEGVYRPRQELFLLLRWTADVLCGLFCNGTSGERREQSLLQYEHGAPGGSEAQGKACEAGAGKAVAPGDRLYPADPSGAAVSVFIEREWKESYEWENIADRWPQHHQPGVLRPAGPDKCGRAAHQRDLWLFEYLAEDFGGGDAPVPGGGFWLICAYVPPQTLRPVQRDEEAHARWTAGTGPGTAGSPGRHGDPAF